MELEDVKRILKDVAEYKGITPISRNIKAQDILDCINELEHSLDGARALKKGAELYAHDLEKKVPRWILVGERKPDLLQQVVIFYGNQYYCVTYYGEPECWGVSGSTKFHPDVVKEWAEIKLEKPRAKEK